MNTVIVPIHIVNNTGYINQAKDCIFIGNMPPPPPPSQSYLWKFDSSSSNSSSDEDDDNDDERRMQQGGSVFFKDQNPEQVQPIRRETTTTKPTTTTTTTATTNTSPMLITPEKVPIQSEAMNQQEEPSSLNQKKNRKRRNRRKGKTNTPKQNVTFGTVAVHSFSRQLGQSVITADGGWPLGLGESISMEEFPIDDFHQGRQLILRDRWIKVTGDQEIPTEPLETRPFDYKKNLRNPLFQPLDEDQRISLLTSTKLPSIINTTGNSRPRSNSDVGNKSRRSKSLASAGTTGPYSSTEILQVRHELEDIRVSRTTDIGCSCRKLVVYIPPKMTDGTTSSIVGKKAAHRRMNERKLKDEVRRRGMWKSGLSREQLEGILHSAIEGETCCSSADTCPCIKNELSCQADICQCWHTSHQTKEYKDEGVSVTSIKERCGNKFGMYVVDAEAISEFRKIWLCQFIDSAE